MPFYVDILKHRKHVWGTERSVYGHTTETFTDNQGKTVLTVVLNGDERLETYYVYDDRELLRWVLSPEAAHRVASSIDTDALYKYAYYYEYDVLKRMTFKKLPGCEPVYMVYDKRDRLVLTQDGNMRASDANKWSYTEYDNKNRPVENGEIVLNGTATHAQLIASMMKSESVPSGTRTPLQYIRYDKYTANEHVTPHAFTPVLGYTEDYHPLTIGLVTATKTKVLGTDRWITSTVYYDSKCRTMQEITDNLVGGATRVTHSYDFVGNVVKSQETYGTNSLEYTYTYDDRSRLLTVTSSLNGGEPVTLKALEYDDVGRLKKVKLHNNTTSSEYAYNIRSWLTCITGSKFSQTLSYGNGNGNIRSMNWNADGSNHSYNFTYDGANRLLDAIHGTGAYTEKVTGYDKNGNILGLQRYGNGLIDDLTYTYSGNQLTKVEDTTGNSAGFSNGASTANEYTYDYNGNLTKDSNKGIANISWNLLNLPNVVTFADGSTVTYTYAADGTKLRTVHSINGTTTQKDYCGSAIYENGIAKLWQTEAGYISMDDSKYHYYLQDHQGNNRVVVSETGAAEEVNHYYAFGGLFGNGNNVQPFKYNGKELDTKKGLNWYDYGARQYDATLGRWFVVDPLAEDYYNWSPYVYCLNTSVNAIDPNGTSTWVVDNGFGTYRVVGGDLNDGDRSIYTLSFGANGIEKNFLGFTTSMTSFYNSDVNDGEGAWAIGSIIDTNDQSGINFLENIIRTNPSMIDEYAMNARTNHKYDFKVTNGTENKIEGINIYRGMPIGKNINGQIIYTSARDIGNITAGYIAGANGMSWFATRIAFDLYQRGIEGKSTRNAEYYGWRMGYNLSPRKRVNNLKKSIKSLFNSLWK